MAIENLPRPWLLAALTGLRLSELLAREEIGSPDRRPQHPLPRPEPRRRRMGDNVGWTRGPAEPEGRLN